jgi:hypothetical protein
VPNHPQGAEVGGGLEEGGGQGEGREVRVGDQVKGAELQIVASTASTLAEPK